MSILRNDRKEFQMLKSANFGKMMILSSLAKCDRLECLTGEGLGRRWLANRKGGWKVLLLIPKSQGRKERCDFLRSFLRSIFLRVFLMSVLGFAAQ